MRRYTSFLLAGFINILVISMAFGNIFPAFFSRNAAPQFKNKHHLNSNVLNLAMRAYTCARKRGIDNKGIITVIDYSLPSTEKRLWVLDLKKQAIPFHTWVAHGQGSGQLRATAFSNKSGSHATSLGVFRTAKTYIGGKGYALNLDGLEPGFNGKARPRRIVFHGANYVSEAFIKSAGYLGRSWGCPALSKFVARKIIDYIKQDTLVVAYYPDQAWLKQSTFLNC